MGEYIVAQVHGSRNIEPNETYVYTKVCHHAPAAISLSAFFLITPSLEQNGLQFLQK